MTFAAQLRKLDACPKAVAWVGDKTLSEAWRTCRRGDWMAWLVRKCGLDSRRAAADIAERVWHLVRPESQLACAWAIDCARRGADEDEMSAAADAAYDAADDAAYDAYAAYDAAYDAAAYAAYAAYDAAAYAAYAAYDAAAYAAYTADDDASAQKKRERAAQATIMRRHFTAAQIEAALKARC